MMRNIREVTPTNLTKAECQMMLGWKKGGLNCWTGEESEKSFFTAHPHA